MSARRLPLWTLLGVALVAALVVGSGVFSSSPPSAAQRASAIESVIRCPSCEDLSVATSSAPTAVAVRDTIRQQVAAGRSDQQIEAYLVARYGSAIVLDPPARGWSLLVWLLPLVGGALAVAFLVVVLVRRVKAADEAADSATGEPADAASLEERRRFLDRSLADADAEFLAGDLSDRDYLALRQRDLRRLAALGSVSSPTAPPPSGTTGLGTLEEERPEAGPDPLEGIDRVDGGGDGDTATTTATPVDRNDRARRPRSRRSRWLLRGAVAAFLAALVVAVALHATARQPGQTASGSVPLTPSQQEARTLDQAATDVNQGQLGPAASLYQSVLARDPNNEVALAQLGWIEYRVGSAGASSSLLTDAHAKLEHAVSLQPGDYAARLYLGSLLLLADHDPAAAVTQYRAFLSDGPPASVVKQAAPELREAYSQAGVALPQGVG
jgi:cytochrome c-type biogenesis protein CcmH